MLDSLVKNLQSFDYYSLSEYDQAIVDTIGITAFEARLEERRMRVLFRKLYKEKAGVLIKAFEQEKTKILTSGLDKERAFVIVVQVFIVVLEY
jgi:hypothetical protein